MHLQNIGPDPLEAGDVSLPLGDGVAQADAQWVEIPFPARLRVTDGNGERIYLEGMLDRLSKSYLWLRLATPLAEGDRLPIVVRLSTSPEPEPAARLAAFGNVASVELQLDGTYRVHVDFTRHWFLYAVGPHPPQQVV